MLTSGIGSALKILVKFLACLIAVSLMMSFPRVSLAADAAIGSFPAGSNDFYGMQVGGSRYTVAKALPGLSDLGVRWVRVWIDADWDQREEPDQFELIREFHTAGYKTIVEFNQAKVPSPDQVKGYFEWALSTGIGEAIDIWEILNEPNFKKYWEGTAKEYIFNVLKPAYETLHAKGG